MHYFQSKCPFHFVSLWLCGLVVRSPGKRKVSRVVYGTMSFSPAHSLLREKPGLTLCNCQNCVLFKKHDSKCSYCHTLPWSMSEVTFRKNAELNSSNFFIADISCTSPKSWLLTWRILLFRFRRFGYGRWPWQCGASCYEATGTFGKSKARTSLLWCFLRDRWKFYNCICWESDFFIEIISEKKSHLVDGNFGLLTLNCYLILHRWILVISRILWTFFTFWATILHEEVPVAKSVANAMFVITKVSRTSGSFTFIFPRGLLLCDFPDFRIWLPEASQELQYFLNFWSHCRRIKEISVSLAFF